MNDRKKEREKEEYQKIARECEREHDKEQLQKQLDLIGDYFPLEKAPDEDCPFCGSTGMVGHFFNTKVIPCRCCYEVNDSWLVGYHKQCVESRATKDTIRLVLKKVNALKKKEKK